MSTTGGFAPNYAWVGAPTVYNGTGYDGGDSGMLPFSHTHNLITSRGLAWENPEIFPIKC